MCKILKKYFQAEVDTPSALSYCEPLPFETVNADSVLIKESAAVTPANANASVGRVLYGTSSQDCINAIGGNRASRLLREIILIPASTLTYVQKLTETAPDPSQHNTVALAP